MDKSRKIIAIDDVIKIAVKLTADLNDDDRKGGINRKDIMKQSGIYNFCGRFPHNGETDLETLDYMVNEECIISGSVTNNSDLWHIYDKSSLWDSKNAKCKDIPIRNEVIGLTWVTVSAYAIPADYKQRKYFNNLKKGDKIFLNGLLVVWDYWYDCCEPKSFLERYNKFPKDFVTGDLPPYCSKLSINIYI